MELNLLRAAPIVLWALSPFTVSEALHAAAGDLDCRFATGGIQVLDFGSVNTFLDAGLQSDGKIVTVGFSGDSIRLSRFLADGSLDPTFGTSGTVAHAFTDLSFAGALAIDSLDRIVVAGRVTVSGDSEVFVSRFTAAGAVDASFGGGDGWTSFDFTPETADAGTEGASAVAVDSSDRPIVGGSADANGPIFNPSDSNMAVARLDASGGLDATFDGDGIALASSPGNATDDDIRGLAIDSAGRIVAVGSSGRVPRDTIVARWLPSGALDTSFDGDGVRLLDLSEAGSDDFGIDVAVDAADLVIVLGATSDDPALARLAADGNLDTAFASDGILQRSFIGGQDVTEHVLIQSDGKILVTGWPVGSSFDFAVMRFTAGGSLDTTWASPDGVVITNIGGQDRAFAALLQPDGKVVLAGSTAGGAALARYLNDGNPNGPATTLVIDSDNPDPSLSSQVVTVTYSVTSSGGTPTGEVRIRDAAASCSGTVASGSCDISLISLGDRTLSAEYIGDGEFCPSSDTEAHFVAARSQTLFLSLSPFPSLVGEAVTVAVRVNSLFGGVGPPTGTVTVDDGAGAGCVGTLVNGEAGCTVVPTVAGSRLWTATYGGDAVFAGSSGQSFHTVGRAATTTQITAATPDPSTVLQPVQVDVTVAAVAPGSGTPAGSVNVDDGAGATCVATLVVGSGSCELTPTVPGTRDITASYAGSASFEASQDSEAHQVLGMDFGDAPATFPTLAADDGARHFLGSGLFLGSAVDSEPDGQPSPAALGDDALGDDEDGVSFSGPAVPGGTISITAQASMAGALDAWVDFNGDGSWDGVAERILNGEAVGPGLNVLPLSLPATAVTGTVIARFRLSSSGVADAGGAAVDGEVEDHALALRRAKIGVGYGASPASVPETGGLLTFTATVANLGEVAVQLSLLDSGLFGDLHGRGDCALPQTLAANGSYSCSFEGSVSGDTGAASDTVAAEARVAGATRSANGEAPFTFTDSLPEVALDLAADPATVPEPQGMVDLTLEVSNQQNEELVLESLTDNVIGNLDGAGDCSLPQTVAALGTYSCTYEVQVQGAAGDTVSHSVTGSGRDDELNSANAGDQATITLTDGIAPQVLSLATLDDSPVTDCATIRTPITGYLVTFDEPVVGAQETTAYLALAAGPDADFSTVDCSAGAAGDDLALALAGATSGGDPETPTITLELEDPAPEALLGLLVCSAVEDEAGNPVDPLLRIFRLDTVNRFRNGDFDRCPTTLEPWEVVATAPNEALPEDAEDADSSSLSGSARILSAAVEPTALGQCVELQSATEFEVLLAARFDPLVAAAATLSVACEFFDQAACGGPPIGEQVVSTPMVDLAGAWDELGFAFTPAGSTLSTLCSVAVAADDADDASFDAFLDRLFLRHTGLIFRDGFESGDTSEW